MSISDIMAIKNLLPGSEPELFEQPREPYKFRDEADEAAALAELERIFNQLREAHGEDQAAVVDELYEMGETNERLRAAVMYSVCRELCETPRIKKLMSKKRRGAKRRDRQT
jgi:hypothetical protein